MADFAEHIRRGIPEAIPALPPEEPGISHAPARPARLDAAERALALQNALRYFPARHHQQLAPEFARELLEDGHIYMRRFRPLYPMKARPIGQYPARSPAAAAIMLMVMNNLDPEVAQHPYELVTYGGNGAVFQNWAQYLLTMKYLSEMTDQQTLVLYSGHPLGLFPSATAAPRVVLTNGMVVPSFSSTANFERLNALGVTSYGQMTAGSFMYIGPQGIVHGTVITLLNAGRKYLKTGSEGLAGRVFVSSGLGGMSGAQAKAAVIAGAVGVVAEIDPHAARKRYEQGWVDELETDLDRVLIRLERARKQKQAVSIAYCGNVVDLWQKLNREQIQIDLGSDQTSLHNPYGGGYYPAGLSLAASRELLAREPALFKRRVQASLVEQVEAINGVCARGMAFWDYGNAFLLEASRAGAAILGAEGGFRYPSYVEHIMGPLCFDHGFGPFRWVCTSGAEVDLLQSDAIACQVLREMGSKAEPAIARQIADNLQWIEQAAEHRLVVGSKARILYADANGRVAIARAFNDAIRAGAITAPIVLGRDHHDVSGTDSPYRETADIRDGSNRCADMAVHNVIGDSFRGATWVSLHNGGGVGWGQALNGGFGLLLDGGADTESRLASMLHWDVNHGVARRAWAGNPGAVWSIGRAMEQRRDLQVTLPEAVDPELVRQLADAAG
jgi:urocanate hydratase